MISNEHDTRTINGLIATTIDSVDGYRAAATEIKNREIAALMLDRANEREEVCSTLQSFVREAGGEPVDDGTTIASAHRFFMGLRDSLFTEDDNAVVAEVERGEDHIKAKYEAALKDTDLSPAAMTMIQQCYASVSEGHDQMRDLKLHATSTY